MGYSYGDPHQNSNSHSGARDGQRGNYRNGRGQGGSREGGGFRIRLSDNEMRASRALQEAFNLRSTVAVLGFSIRTLAQMLEEGKLNELVEEYRARNPQAQNRREDGRQGNRRNNSESNQFGNNQTQPKANPFARPEKPKQTEPEIEIENNLNNDENQLNEEITNTSADNEIVEAKENSLNIESDIPEGTEGENKDELQS